MDSHQRHSGFTLIELSITLVIIGLVVGGVLYGQDLIKAARVRAAITQIERYKSAVNVFQTKYDLFPGDLTTDDAQKLNFLPTTRSYADATVLHGDGRLESSSTGKELLASETALFWRDLSSAKMIEDNFATATDIIAASLTSSQLPLYLPRSKFDKNYFHAAFFHNGKPYFYFAKIIGTLASGEYNENGKFAFKPADALVFDQKMDDGLPLSGGVVAGSLDETGNGVLIGAFSGLNRPMEMLDNALQPVAINCTKASQPETYDISFTTPECTLAIRMK